MTNNEHDDTQRRLISRTLTDYLLYFPAVVTSGLMGLVTVAVLSKFFGPAEFGHYTLAFQTMLLLAMITGLWLHASVMRLLPQYVASGQIHEFIGTLASAGALFTLVVVLLYALVLPLFKASLEAQLYQLLWLVVPGVLILTIFSVLQESHRIQERAALYSGLTLLRVVGGFGVGLALAVVFDWGLAGMLGGMILVMAGAVAGHVLFGGGHLTLRLRRLAWSRRVLKDMLAFSLPIVGLNLASTVLSISDRYLIEAYLTSYDLGIYSVGYTLAEGGMRLIANTFLTASEPTVFNTWVKHGPEAAFQFLERLFRYYLMLGLPALVGISLFRQEIVTLFATPEYVQGAAVVIYVSLAIFMHGYSLLVGLVFDATKRTMIPFWTFLMAALFNTGLNLILLPRFGYLAAAWTTCAGYGLLFILNVMAARRIAPLRVAGGYVWKIGLASAGMGVFVVAMQGWLPASILTLIMTISLAALVYGMLLFVIGAISPQEKQALKARLKGILIRPAVGNEPV